MQKYIKKTNKTLIDQYENFLNPDELKSNLIFDALYVCAFEILKDCILSRIRVFFSDGFDGNEFTVGADYQKKVLSLNKSPIYASLMWLRNMEIIDDKDIETFETIKTCRNYIAHEMIDAISNGIEAEYINNFGSIIELLDKIETWWIINVDIATDPNFDGHSVDKNEILPGSIAYLKLMQNIALGDEEEASKYYKWFQQHAKSI